MLSTALTAVQAQQSDTGTLHVSCDQPAAVVYVDGQLKGNVPLSLTLKGDHNIRVENDINNYYRYTKLVTFTPGMNEQLDVTLQAMPPKLNVMVSAQYGFGNHDFGLMAGLCSTWGAYVRFATNFGSNEGTSVVPTMRATYKTLTVKSLENPYSMTISLGVMRRINKQIYVFAGGGTYEYSAGVYNMDFKLGTTDKLKPYTMNGLCLDAGVIYKFHALLFSAGYQTALTKNSDAPSGSSWGNVFVGLGINIHKNIKR